MGTVSDLRGPLACVAALAVGGCTVIVGTFLEKVEVVAYARHGVEFSHRRDWTVTAKVSTTMDVESATITIVGPDSALVVIQRFGPWRAIDPEELLEDFTSGTRASPEGPVSGLGPLTPVTRTILDSERTGEESHFSVSVDDQVRPYTVQLFPIVFADRSVVVFTQVADEDRADTTEGFDTILDSLVVR